MHPLSPERGAASTVRLGFHRASWLAAAGLIAAITGQARAAEPSAQGPPQAAWGDPVNLYALGGDPYGPQEAEEIHAWHVAGQVWLMTGEPGESNVEVQLGNEGVLVVDTGTQAMAPMLLARIQRLALEHSGGQVGDQTTVIRQVVDTNGLADHIGGNGVIRNAGSQITGGPSAAQNDLAPEGAEVLANQNVLTRLALERAAGGESPPQALWPSDVEESDIYPLDSNGEALELDHPPSANTDGQLIVLFRGSNVIAAGDVVDMTSYPIIDVAQGGTIDGELIALNRVIDMAVAAGYSEGGTIIVPGHGRLCDQAEVAQYTNMITVIRNLVQYYKDQGKTLEQVLALKLTAGYDERWGRTSGPWTTTDFITAVYKTLPAKGAALFSMYDSTTVR